MAITSILGSIYQNPDCYQKWLELFAKARGADFYRQKRDPLAVSWEAFAQYMVPVEPYSKFSTEGICHNFLYSKELEICLPTETYLSVVSSRLHACIMSGKLCVQTYKSGYLLTHREAWTELSQWEFSVDISGRCIIAIGDPTPNLYHFYYSVLSKVLICQDRLGWAKEDITIVMDMPLKKWIIDIFAVYGFQESQLISLKQNCLLRLRSQSIAVCSLAEPPHYQALPYLIQTIGQLPTTQNCSTQRFIVDRRSSNNGAQSRNIANKDEMYRFAETHKFSVVYFEDLDWVQQMTIITNSSCLIFVHGAAMSHIFAASKNILIVELFYSRHTENISLFADIASLVGLRYLPFPCDSPYSLDNSGNIHPRQMPLVPDIRLLSSYLLGQGIA